MCCCQTDWRRRREQEGQKNTRQEKRNSGPGLRNAKAVAVLFKEELRLKKELLKLEDELKIKTLDNAKTVMDELNKEMKAIADKGKKNAEELQKRIDKDKEARHKLKVARKQAEAEELADLIEIEKMKHEKG